MKKFTISVLMIVSLFIYNISRSNYSTPGTGRNWTLDSLIAFSSGAVVDSLGFILIKDNITISQSDTLKILNNRTIKVGSSFLIYITGVLKINPPDSVKMTAIDTSFKYFGIKLDSLSDVSVLKKLIFEYGNAISLLDCDMSIDSCTIRNNPYISGQRRGAIYLFRSNPVISHCKIYRNGNAAIQSGANIASSPTIIDNLIYENDVENGNYPQINLGAAGNSPVIIRNNIIRGLYPMSGGISFLPAGSVPLVIIENNIIKKNRYGIAMQGSNINAYINNNIIDSNNIQGLPLLGGSGINFIGGATNVAIVTRNTIRWNLWGITIQTNARPDIGNIYNSDTSDNGFNKIYYNSHNDTTFDLYNNTPDSIKAQNNYWGTINPDTVASHIFGHHNNPALGVVDYLPIWTLTSINNNYEFIKDFRLFEAYPNPFNPVTNIKFQIPANEFVKLEVYDISGKIVDVLINGNLNAGIYEAKWNAENFSSGIYFYRLSSKNYSDTKKIILLK